jgi:hypothetical protein
MTPILNDSILARLQLAFPDQRKWVVHNVAAFVKGGPIFITRDAGLQTPFCESYKGV